MATYTERQADMYGNVAPAAASTNKMAVVALYWLGFTSYHSRLWLESRIIGSQLDMHVVDFIVRFEIQFCEIKYCHSQT